MDAFVSRSLPEPFWNTLRESLTRVMVGCSIALLFALMMSKLGTYWIFFSVERQTMTGRWRVLAVALVFFDLNASNWLVANKTEADRANRDELSVLTGHARRRAVFKKQAGTLPSKCLLRSRPELRRRFRHSEHLRSSCGGFRGIPSNLRLLGSRDIFSI